jgi:vacuolar-type H+-ATPase subunit I/STV1
MPIDESEFRDIESKVDDLEKKLRRNERELEDEKRKNREMAELINLHSLALTKLANMVNKSATDPLILSFNRI